MPRKKKVFPFIMIYYSDEMDILQQCMLYIFVILQLVVLVIFCFVIQTHYWTWHIFPIKRLHPIRLKRIKSALFYEDIIKYYKHICDCYTVEQMILEKYGANVGQIVLLYYDNIVI